MVLSIILFFSCLLGTNVFGATTFYYYDSSNRLISKTVTNDEGMKISTEYSYDDNGNLLRKKIVPNLNNLTNADFEIYTGTNGVADNWKIYKSGVSNSNYSLSPNAYTGKQAQQIQVDSSEGGAIAGVEQQITITGGQPFMLGSYIRANQLSNSIVQFGIRFYDVNQQIIGDEFRQLTSTEAQYVHLVSSGVTPANTVSAKVYVVLQSNAAQGSGLIVLDAMNLGFGYSGKAISLGDVHALAIRNDGSAWGWGLEMGGQVPDNNDTPVPFTGLENVISVAGLEHSVFLLQNGTVWGTGYNSHGELGIGTTERSNVPVQALNISNVYAIDSGFYYVIALKEDGTVWSWGYNNSGQLGDGTQIDKHIPVQITGLSNIVDIASGNFHNLALKNDGTVWAWGNGSLGGLGTGKSNNELIPVQVPGLNSIKAIGTGNDYSFAISTDGMLWGWGRNSYGALGDGTNSLRLSPVPVTGISNVIAVDGGDGHTLALTADGRVWSWGRNSFGQLGLGDNKELLLPKLVSSLSGITDITAGADSSIALRSDGTLLGWGSNVYGVLGKGVNEANTPIPVFTRGYENIPPSIPSDVSVISNTDTTLKLSWNPSSDNSGIAHYEIYNQGAILATSKKPTIELTKLQPNTTYTLTVQAVDLSGNRSESSNAIVIVTNLDTAAPSPPSRLGQEKITTNSVLLKWEASKDNVGVVSYDVYSGEELVLTTSQLTGLIENLLPGASYTFVVKARDAAGNVSEGSPPLTLTIPSDTDPPAAPIDLRAGTTRETSINLSWTRSTDYKSISGYEILMLTGEQEDKKGSTTSTSYTVNNLLPATTYSFALRAVDSSGNKSPLSNVVTVQTRADTIKPSVPTGLRLVNVVDNTITLQWEASTDNVAVAGYDVYEGTNLVASSVLPSAGVINLTPNTEYQFTVSAKDASGNVSNASSPLKVIIIPDTEAPIAPTSLNWSERYTNGVKLYWEASTDNANVVEYQIYRDGIHIGTSAVTEYTDLQLNPDNLYTYTVIAKDGSGNLSAASLPLSVKTKGLLDTSTLMNADFENYNGPSGVADGWVEKLSPNSMVQFQAASAPFHSGQRSQMIKSVLPMVNDVSFLSQTIDIEPSQQFHLKSHIQIEQLTQAMLQMKIVFYSADGQKVAEAITDRSELTEGFIPVTIDGQIPANAIKAEIEIGLLAIGNDASASIYVDAMEYSVSNTSN